MNNQQWPTRQQIVVMLANDPNDSVLGFATRIEHKWINSLLQNQPVPLTIPELKIEHEAVFPPNDNDCYSKQQKVFRQYYLSLEHKVFNNLYNNFKRCLSMDEIEENVPHVFSKSYNRERVILQYMVAMQDLKPRGEEWEKEIESLKESLEKKN
jgi:hypothetical protein